MTRKYILTGKEFDKMCDIISDVRIGTKYEKDALDEIQDIISDIEHEMYQEGYNDGYNDCKKDFTQYE